MSKYGHGKTGFQEKWLSDPELKSWILKVPSNVHSAKCRFCPSAFISISFMGRQALTSHMKGQKHMKASAMLSSPSLGSYLSKPCSTLKNPISTAPASVTNPSIIDQDQPSTSKNMTPPFTDQPSVSSNTSLLPLGQLGLKKYVVNEQATKAEIIWAINCVVTHTSFRSAASGIEAMKLMFPDSTICSRIDMHRTKMNYLISFGLAPYFLNELMNSIQQSTCYVVSFDESLNKISTKQQMDVLIRFWDDSRNEVTTRYLTSAFLSSAKAVDLQHALIKAIEQLDMKKLVQISMDGPNVNKKLYSDLQVFLNEEVTNKKMIDLGTCSLHTIHNAFKVAMVSTGWKIMPFLRALYNFFKCSPARRGEFTRITGTTTFPKKFCPVRWLENADVSQRALELLPNLRKYVAVITEEKKKAASLKGSFSFEIIKECLNDPMIGPKLAVFKTIATDVEPFLKEFQSNWPYTPFLGTILNTLIKDLMMRFVKPDKLQPNVDFEEEDNLIPFKKIDLGFSARAEIMKVTNAKEIDVSMLRKEAKRALKLFVKKVIISSPLKLPVINSLTSLDPKIAAKEKGTELFNNLVETFTDNFWISTSRGDKIVRQFKTLVQSDNFKDASKDFKRSKTRLDKFWMELVENEQTDDVDELKYFFKMTLILSHGNAQVERGFSINKECLVDNMKDTSLVGIRMVHDAIMAEGGLKNVAITKSLIHYARNSSSKYKAALELNKSAKLDQNQIEDVRKRKKKLINELKAKRSKLLEDSNRESQELQKRIHDLSKEV